MIGVAVVVMVVLLGYFQVPLRGKTFSTAAFVAGADGCATPSGACLPPSPKDPRVDLHASASQAEPWLRLTHRTLADGDVPLWNASQGLGMPLAGNMQSGVFDPLLLPLHLHPSALAEDLTWLFELLLVGVAGYVAARVLRLAPIAATLVGSVYGLSGWFFVYGNNQFVHAYLFLPLILACIEWSLRSRRMLPPVLLALSVAGLGLVGMPEPTFITLIAAGLYSTVRLFVGPTDHSRIRGGLRLLGGVGLGLALAGPQLTLFVEFLSHSYNQHTAHQMVRTWPPSHFLNWMMPKIMGIPKAQYGSNESTTGPTLNWVGAATMLAVFIALLHPRALRRYGGWPLLAVGVLLALAVYGGHLVTWTRNLPVWSQVYFWAFGTPVLALVLALLAAITVQAGLDGALVRHRVLLALAALVAATVATVLAADASFDLGHQVSVVGGWPLAAAAVALIIGAFLVRAPRAAAVVLVAVAIIEMVAIAPRSQYASRADPFPRRDWITYLQAQTADGSRIFSTTGPLQPDTAAAYGLRDPRMVDALYVDRYWQYVRNFVSKGIVDRFNAVGPSEGAPAVANNAMFDLLGVRFIVYRTQCLRAADPTCASPNAPPADALDQYRLVYTSRNIRVYENTHVAPRAFVVHTVQTVGDMFAAIRYLRHGELKRFPSGSVQVVGKDVRRLAVVESDPGAGPQVQRCSPATLERAQITSYQTNSVTMRVDAKCPGLLVFSDQHYPGWEATVNGHDGRVYPTDVTMRGVVVPGGRSTVVFRYRPSSLRIGLVLSILGLLVLLGVAARGALTSSWWRARTRRRASDPAAVAP